jgi:biotin-dependent carboxylase-like uncharacterized protein
MSMIVLKPGIQPSFQDLGRVGYQQLGVPVTGVMDTRAHQLANILVGNSTDQASLEITLTGPSLEFTEPCCIALTGADLSPALNGQPVAMNRPIIIRAQDTLTFGPRRIGTRAYMAIHDGFKLTRALGSNSTHMRCAIGGWQGRALKRGDRIEFNRSLACEDLEGLAQKLWSVKIYLPAALVPSTRARVRMVTSEQFIDFTSESQHALTSEIFRISPDSERMGYRLQGPEIKLTAPRQMLSEAATFGTIQVPAGGQPIILMADRQTTGGYPKIGYVASVDLPLLAQMGPGDSFGFEVIPLDQAQALDAQRTKAFAALAEKLAPERAYILQHYP